jgi:hypothetical protein
MIGNNEITDAVEKLLPSDLALLGDKDWTFDFLRNRCHG